MKREQNSIEKSFICLTDYRELEASIEISLVNGEVYAYNFLNIRFRNGFHKLSIPYFKQD